MNDQDRQLVELITQQVLALLRSASAPATAASAPAGPVPHAAPVHPPIGQCTGDYSKFPELAGRLYGNASPASLAVAAAALKAKGKSGADGGETVIDSNPNPSPMPSPRGVGVVSTDTPTPRGLGIGLGEESKPRPLPLTGIITANQLQEAIKASPDGVVWLAPQARLTPLANDFARQKKDQVRRGEPLQESPAKPTPSVGGSVPTSQWLWWIEGGCPVVRDVTQSFGLALRPVAAGPTAGALPQVVRELARAVKSKQVAGGILFVPSAARAACMANRSSSLRAIVGTCGEAVEQGIRDIGANVLIIEYPHHGHRSTAAMLQRFTQQIPSAPPSVERELADLQRQ